MLFKPRKKKNTKLRLIKNYFEPPKIISIFFFDKYCEVIACCTININYITVKLMSPSHTLMIFLYINNFFFSFFFVSLTDVFIILILCILYAVGLLLLMEIKMI